MIVIIAGDDHQLQPNGEVQSVAVPVTLRNVKNVYIYLSLQKTINLNTLDNQTCQVLLHQIFIHLN